MTYFKQKPGSIEEVIAKQQSQYQDPNYKAKFDEALKDSIRGIGSMTPKEKTEFFNKLDAVKKEDAKKVQKKNVDTKREQKEEWKPSNGKHADESLMKDFIDKGGKVEKIPEGKTAYIGNKIKPHLANERNLERQKQMTEETISERGGANTSSRQGSFAKSRKPKYRFGYRVAEKQPKGNDIEETFSQQQIKQAYGILNDPRYKQGNYSGAVAAIEKLAKGLSKHPDVANALKRANESVEHDSAFAISGVETERPTEDIQEGNWRIYAYGEYKHTGGADDDKFNFVIQANSEQDAIRKAEDMLDKARDKGKIGPRRGGGIELTDIGAERTNARISPKEPSNWVESVEMKETIDAGEVSKMKDKKKEVDFKTANVSTTETIDAGEVSKMADKKKEVKFSTANVSTTEDKKDPKKEVIGNEKPEPSANLENTIRNIWNKAANETTERGDSVLLPTRNESKIPPIKPDNKPGVKIAKIRATRDKEDGPADGAKDPTAMEKQILTLQGQVNVLKAKLENEKGKVVKPVADKETGQVPLTVGLAHKLLKDKAEKEEDKEVKKEAVSPYKLKYETLRARLKEKADKEKLAKKKDEPTKGRTMTGNPASKVNTDPEINYNQ